ncbi:DNA recombination protein RmuC [Elioraea sp.]|uniref:DNA recombination protein RmuC n=1 Tax=Elioraea sp. TaxID=2185103 RepID=UPI003F6F82EE
MSIASLADAPLAWIALGLALLVAVLLLRRPAVPPELISGLAQLSGRLDQLTRTAQAQGMALASQETALADRLAAQQLAIAEGLARMGERLSVLDSAQANLSALTAQVTDLSAVLSNRQARGALGEAQMEALLRDALPAAALSFQHTLSTGARADALIRLPMPPGPIAVDSKFPLEAFRRLRAAESDAARIAAGRDFAADVLAHVKAVAAKYVVPGETADGAILFVPSEAVYAALHADFPQVVEDAIRRRVWITSPTTLMAVLTTLAAVLRDARLRDEARAIQAGVARLAEDAGRLGERVTALRRHLDQARADIQGIEVSAEAIRRRAGHVAAIETDKE